MFYLGNTEEQALIGNLRGKGLVIITGCGHPTIEVIIRMAKSIVPDVPVYAIIGGLHFPVKESRGKIWGLPFQTILGTGKPVWKKINDDDLDLTIDFLKSLDLKKLLLSAHDSCDYALNKIQENIHAETIILEAGGIYEI